jgi:hypothetical protein
MGGKAMLREELHISDEELLQAADGELGTRRADQVHAHLAACWNCRARMAEIEWTIADFVCAHRQSFDSQLPSADGPRALLRAQLSELASRPSRDSRQWFARFSLATRTAAMCVAALTATLVGALMLQHSIQRGGKASVDPFEGGALPKRSLTPGATRSVTIGDVCSMAHEAVVREVSTSMRQKVFQEYGIMNARAGEYEIDYLIAPGLGGAEDIHNLWPQPNTSRTWNAYVKDALEERLHQLVCSGDLDLPTAQRDISTDWIAAYKKYFHTDRPLSKNSRLDSGNEVAVVMANLEREMGVIPPGQYAIFRETGSSRIDIHGIYGLWPHSKMSQRSRSCRFYKSATFAGPRHAVRKALPEEQGPSTAFFAEPQHFPDASPRLLLRRGAPRPSNSLPNPSGSASIERECNLS